MSSLFDEVRSLVFDDQDVKTVTKNVTLATLLKMISSLKQHQAGESNLYSNKKKKKSARDYDGWSSVPDSFYKTPRTIDLTQIILKNAGDQMLEKTQVDFDEKVTETKRGYLSTEQISYDIGQLEIELRKANVTCGIHKIVMTLEFVSSSLTMLGQLLSESDKSNFNVGDVVSAYNSYVTQSKVTVSEYKPSMKVNVYNTKDLESKIKKLKSLKEKLTSKRDMLNNTTKVDVHLSKDSMEILGLDFEDMC